MKRITCFKIVVLSLSILFSLTMIEFFLRIVSPSSPFSPLIPLRPYNRMELHVKLKGVSPIAIHSTNKWGLRGEDVPADWNKFYTIITIGGSTTQCYYLDDHKTWPYLLQQRLKEKNDKVWVGNAGLDGQTTRAHLIFMKEVIPKMKPKTVILLVGFNDLGLSLSEDARLFGSPWDKTSLKYKIYANSRLIQILHIWKLIIFDKVVVVKKMGHGDYEPKASVSETPFPSDLRSLLPSLEEYRQNIKEIIDTAKSMNIRAIFLTQPVLYDNTEYWKKIEGGFYWIKKTKNVLSAATFSRLLDIYNKELMEICKANNVECFDLASAIPHSSLYFYDAAHLNEKGAQLVAEKIAEYFKI